MAASVSGFSFAVATCYLAAIHRPGGPDTLASATCAAVPPSLKSRMLGYTERAVYYCTFNASWG